MGNCLMRHYKDSGYFVVFDREKGTTLRVGYHNIEPFWNVIGPELLDIAITNYCERGCDFCYRASNLKGQSMSIERYEEIMKQAEKVGVMQVALGGGNPNQHPQFVEFLKITKMHHIVPSYTTNGQGMTEEIYDATKKYCGAIAVSWYEPFDEVLKVIQHCNEKGIKVNIHYLLHKNSIEKAIDFLREQTDILKSVNAVVFLNYKPIHSTEELLLRDDLILQDFLEEVMKVEDCKIGFDSCMISYLTKISESLLLETADFCEAGRFSAFISETGMLYPCSFMNDTECAGIDLQKYTLQEGWQHGEIFLKMRRRLQNPSAQQYPIERCCSCEQYTMCHGGCPIFPINRCKD